MSAPTCPSTGTEGQPTRPGLRLTAAERIAAALRASTCRPRTCLAAEATRIADVPHGCPYRKLSPQEQMTRHCEPCLRDRLEGVSLGCRRRSGSIPCARKWDAASEHFLSAGACRVASYDLAARPTVIFVPLAGGRAPSRRWRATPPGSRSSVRTRLAGARRHPAGPAS